METEINSNWVKDHIQLVKNKILISYFLILTKIREVLIINSLHLVTSNIIIKMRIM